MELLALITAAEGDAAEAAVLQGSASRMWPSVGLPLFGSAYYNAPHEQCEATARERLGDERYEECVRAGARLGRQAAVGRALGHTRPQLLGALPPPRGLPEPLDMRKPEASPTRKGGETTG